MISEAIISVQKRQIIAINNFLNNEIKMKFSLFIKGIYLLSSSFIFSNSCD